MSLNLLYKIDCSIAAFSEYSSFLYRSIPFFFSDFNMKDFKLRKFHEIKCVDKSVKTECLCCLWTLTFYPPIVRAVNTVHIGGNICVKKCVGDSFHCSCRSGIFLFIISIFMSSI